MDNKRSEFLNRINSLEYNPMCYNCKLKASGECNGTKDKVYTNCIHKETDEKQQSIYVQIYREVYK